MESHLLVQYRADHHLGNKKNLHSVVDTNQKLLLISSRKTREATDHGKWDPLSPSTAHQTQQKYLSKDHFSRGIFPVFHRLCPWVRLKN